MENKDFNFNYSECIKSYDTFGTTHYVNVCNNNKKQDVPWGVSGWLVCVFLVTVILSIVFGVLSVIVVAVRDIW